MIQWCVEQLRVQHIVRDRKVFADGALVAARWLAGRRGVFHDGRRAPGCRRRRAWPMTARLVGYGTALLTPFGGDGAVDETALRRFVEWQVTEGIDFVVPCGTTGEAVTLTPRSTAGRGNHRRAGGRKVPVVAGAGSNDTRRAIAQSRDMQDAGATHLLHVTRMYNKPPQRGLGRALSGDRGRGRAAHHSVQRPGPHGREPGCGDDARTGGGAGHRGGQGGIRRPGADHGDPAGAAGGFLRVVGRRRAALAVVAAGGDGVISVTSNATPKRMAALVRAARRRSAGGAAEHFALTPWMRPRSWESIFAGRKAALQLMGFMGPVHRSPLVPLAERHLRAVRAALAAAGALTDRG